MKFRDLAFAAATAIAAATLPGQAVAQQELRVMTFEGYAEPAWLKPFEEANNVTVKTVYIGSNDEYMAKLAADGGKGEYDIVLIASSLAQPAIRAGFVEPLNVDLLPNLADQSEVLRNLPYHLDGDTTYGVCIFWGTAPVTVGSKDVPEGAGFEVLFDPKNKGKIAMWDDVSTIADVANYMGYKNIWDLTDEELDAVKAKMIEQKPLLRKYWTRPGELIELFKGGEVVAANSWNYVTNTLNADGFAAHEVSNKTPVAWVDDYFIAKGTKNLELAHKFVDYVISPEVQAMIAEHTGYSVCNPKSKEFMKPETWSKLQMTGMAELLGSAILWEEIPRRDRYNEVLNEVKGAQ